MSTSALQSLQNQLEDLRARNRDLEIALGQSNNLLAVTFKLTPALSNALGLLISLPVVSEEVIRQRVEIGSEPKTIMYRLRLRLDEWCDKRGVKRFQVTNSRRLGYHIEYEDKLRLKQYVAETEQAIAESSKLTPAPIDTSNTAA